MYITQTPDVNTSNLSAVHIGCELYLTLTKRVTRGTELKLFMEQQPTKTEQSAKSEGMN